MSDTAAGDLSGEQPTLYKLICRHKWRATRLVRSVRDSDGIIQTSPAGIASVFTTFFQTKYNSIEADPVCVHALANMIRAELPPAMELTRPHSPLLKYTMPSTWEGEIGPRAETAWALTFIKPHGQSPVTTSVAFSTLCSLREPSPLNKVCLPKPNQMLTPADRRPITLLNSDYKIVTRIIDQRLRPIMETHLLTSQYCSVPGNTILDAWTQSGTPLPALNIKIFQCAYSRLISNMHLIESPTTTYSQSFAATASAPISSP